MQEANPKCIEIHPFSMMNKSKFSAFGTVPKSEKLHSTGSNLWLNFHWSLEKSMECS